MNATRAVLRDENGEHLCVLTDEVEIERLERRTVAGEVIKSNKMKKGRLTVIFRLRAVELRPVKPSNSQSDECSLSEEDAMKLAGCCGVLTTREAERLMGHGIQINWKRRKRSAAVR